MREVRGGQVQGSIGVSTVYGMRSRQVLYRPCSDDGEHVRRLHGWGHIALGQQYGKQLHMWAWLELHYRCVSDMLWQLFVLAIFWNPFGDHLRWVWVVQQL